MIFSLFHVLQNSHFQGGFYWYESFIKKKWYTHSFGNNGRQVQASKLALLVAQTMPNNLMVSMDSLGSDFISRGKFILKIKKKADYLPSYNDTFIGTF